MAHKLASSDARGMLMRLRHDQGGNAIAIVGAALIPLTVMIGSGVDASRSYMVKARLQQACDASVLAGRKAVGEGSFDANALSRANTFFENNFPTGYQGTTNTTYVASSPDLGTTVRGVATTTLPTVIMGLFAEKDTDTAGQRASKERIQARNERQTGNDDGILTSQSITLSVECDAKLEISNSDITMVLDTTGSMVCPDDVDLAGCQSYIAANGIVPGAGGTTSRISALRTAMKNFNSIIDSAASGSSARVRYSFVPYSGTVNVGKLLYDRDPSWLIGGAANESYSYQTRRAVYQVTTTTTANATTSGTETLTQVDAPECFNRFSQNQAISGYWSPGQTGWQYTTGQNATKTGQGTARYNFTFRSWDGSTAAPNLSRTGSSWWRTCIRNFTRTGMTTTTTTSETFDGTLPGATFLRYEYAQASLPVSNYVRSIITTNPAVRIPSEPQSNTATTRWGGCIEERDTVAVAAFTYNTASEQITPGGANDLDIDGVPTNNNTKWRPYWPEITYYRTTADNFTLNASATSNNGQKVQTACPVAAQLLTPMTTTAFSAYADSLVPNGGTYHDIGMIWATRLSSPDGIFSANVNDVPGNAGFVSRHIIFMTDGQLDTGTTYGSAYGIEYHDRRVTADGLTDQNARHINRFAAVCQAARAKGIRVWVIAFGTSLSTEMTACASANSSFTSTDADSLNETFVTIAQSVADLRLSQ